MWIVASANGETQRLSVQTMSQVSRRAWNIMSYVTIDMKSVTVYLQRLSL